MACQADPLPAAVSPSEGGGAGALGVAGRGRWEGEAIPCEAWGVWDWARCALVFLTICIEHHLRQKPMCRSFWFIYGLGLLGLGFKVNPKQPAMAKSGWRSGGKEERGGGGE